MNNTNMHILMIGDHIHFRRAEIPFSVLNNLPVETQGEVFQIYREALLGNGINV